MRLKLVSKLPRRREESILCFFLLFHFSGSVCTVLPFVMSQIGLIVSVQAASTPHLMLRRTRSISPLFSTKPPIELLHWSATQPASTFTLGLAQIFVHGMLRLTIMCLGDLTPRQHSEPHDSASHSGSCNANYIRLHPLLHNPAYFYHSAVSSGICLVFASFQTWRRYNTASV